MDNALKIAFVCVNYNNSDITLEYILNVIKIKKSHEVKIIVVDNASAPGDIAKLEKHVADYSDAILIRSDTNLGYFKGLNLGIDWALKNGFNQYQVVGNNDIEFHDNFLEVLQNLPLSENELIISPDIITINGIHENPHVVKRVSPVRMLMFDIYYSNYFFAKIITSFYSEARKPKPFDPERKHIYMGNGALYVLTPYFFKHFHKLWDILFLYGEEAILGGQIASVDGKILYEPELKCNHNESSTTSKLGSKKKYYIVRESYKVYRKYLKGNAKHTQ
ncbi:glycosyltransferase family 2 protein [Daejeonella oryzae]|uniref:glycosyltransferase family 2 protein n=1 Tax=Daejeonella oryzae TaxID=1122943 RepID=UPI0004174963|nr:glycosyltransferase [Daejeonella oryzae]